LNEGTLSCDKSDSTLVNPIDDQVNSSRKIDLCSPRVDIYDLNESLDFNTIYCFSHENLEGECLYKEVLLFDDDITHESAHSEMPYNVGSVSTLEGYHLFENLLGCDDTLSDRMKISFMKMIIHLLESVVLRKKVMLIC